LNYKIALVPVDLFKDLLLRETVSREAGSFGSPNSPQEAEARRRHFELGGIPVGQWNILRNLRQKAQVFTLRHP
jgi:hypothetical protein